MFNLVFIKEGLITSYAKVEHKELYDENVNYNGQSIKFIPEELASIDAGTFITKYYVKNGLFKQLPSKDTDYLIWDLFSESWLEPVGYLETLKTTNTAEVNKLAEGKILGTYPFYLQHNIGRDPTSLLAIAMFTCIDSIRALAQTAKTAIGAATSIVDIRTAQTIFIEALAAL